MSDDETVAELEPEMLGDEEIFMEDDLDLEDDLLVAEEGDEPALGFGSEIE